jgi:hypothetical protein
VILIRGLLAHDCPHTQTQSLTHMHTNTRTRTHTAPSQGKVKSPGERGEGDRKRSPSKADAKGVCGFWLIKSPRITHVHACTHTHTHIRTHTHTHTHRHTHTRTHTHTHTRRRRQQQQRAPPLLLQHRGAPVLSAPLHVVGLGNILQRLGSAILCNPRQAPAVVKALVSVYGGAIAEACEWEGWGW